MEIRIKSAQLVPDQYGSNIRITKVGLYNLGKFVKWIKLDEKLLELITSVKLPIDNSFCPPFIKDTENILNSLIGTHFILNFNEFIAKCELTYLPITRDEGYFYYGSKKLDVCLEFDTFPNLDASDNSGEETFVSKLIGVYFYPKYLN